MDLAELAGVTDPEALDRADRESERLLEELKKEVRVELTDVGTLRKQMRVTVPAKVIASHLERNYDELRHDAVVPGFRKGRAPLPLIQKRFGAEIRDSLKTSVVGQSFFAALENHKLEALGDPLFRVDVDGGAKLSGLDEALPHLRLPDDGDFTYVCEVEIKPAVELPELKGIEIKSPKIQITDEDVEAAVLRQRKIRGRYEPIEGAAHESDDLVIADVKLEVDGQTIKEEANVQLGVRAARLDGVPLMNLAKVLKGVKPGQTRNTDAKIPDDYEREDLRGKQGQFTFVVHEIKRLAPAPLETLLSSFGAESEKELREMIRDDMERERDRLVARAKREQVCDYLLKQIPLDLPEALSARQTDRAVMRRVVELSQNGVPDSEIEAHIDELRTSAREEVARALRLEFILEKVAQRLEVEVTDEEVNSEIARMARLYNRRFDRTRDELQRRGLLEQLGEQIRQDKCVELLLKDATIVEVEPEKPKRKRAAKKAKDAAAPDE
jgi:trigger factor